MNTIPICLSDVEVPMLVEVQKRDKTYRDLQSLLLQLIKQEFVRGSR